MENPNEIIKRIRLDKGLTLKEVVDAAKREYKDSSLSVSYLSMIENGKREADAQKLNEIAAGLGVPAMKLRLQEFRALLDAADIPEDKRPFAETIKQLLELTLRDPP